ncbi:zinc-binding alcohol dehydrogenase [Halobacteria archaeon AArc-dxtr1]|nr:zinc-binding alcohol dehydrogenase [Halobacteria archaeon AArc-dxtr1]
MTTNVDERRSLYVTGPGQVTHRQESLPEPDRDEIQIRTAYSAISAGTERLLFEGEVPTKSEPDDPIDAIATDFSYPLKYGYAAVGHVMDVGSAVDDEWLDRRVFAYNPHESGFTVEPSAVVPLSPACSPETATLLANIETAVTLALDGAPVVGERVAIFGQGVVGLLTTAVLSRYPLDTLVTVDHHERRRKLSERLGADLSIDPAEASAEDVLEGDDRADLTYELTGSPAALDDAITATGYDGRVVVGSWYGSRTAPIDLGGRFHRSRISIESSQVSTIAPEYTGRWSRERRHDLALDLLAEIPAEELITHRIPFERAREAYELVADRPHEAVGVLLEYGRHETQPSADDGWR